MLSEAHAHARRYSLSYCIMGTGTGCNCSGGSRARVRSKSQKGRKGAAGKRAKTRHAQLKGARTRRPTRARRRGGPRKTKRSTSKGGSPYRMSQTLTDAWRTMGYYGQSGLNAVSGKPAPTSPFSTSQKVKAPNMEWKSLASLAPQASSKTRKASKH